MKRCVSDDNKQHQQRRQPNTHTYTQISEVNDKQMRRLERMDIEVNIIVCALFCSPFQCVYKQKSFKQASTFANHFPFRSFFLLSHFHFLALLFSSYHIPHRIAPFSLSFFLHLHFISLVLFFFSLYRTAIGF